MRGQKRIGFDTRNTAMADGTGVATYAAMLAALCGTIGFVPQFLNAAPGNNRIQRIFRAALPFRRIGEAFSLPDIYRVAQLHFDLYGRPLQLRTAHPPALMHWTYPLPLLLAGCRNVLTIHDLVPLLQADLTGIDGRRLRRLLRLLVRRVDGVITVSETVRGQVIAELGVPPARVRTLYQAVDVKLPAQDLPDICPAGSFLVVGNVEPRKNIRRLIAAHAASHVSAPLVIIGPDGDGAAAELGNAGPDVIRIPYATRELLLTAMSKARAVLFPSLGEGFGLPMVEGFALGVPVMTSRRAALEEIAGNAAVLVNPEDVDEMAMTIKRLADDDAFRGRLSALGLARSRFFASDAYAARLRDYYEEICAADRKHHAGSDPTVLGNYEGAD